MKINLISRKNTWFYITFAVLDILAVGAGMGVPFFAILLGGAIGWLAPMRYSDLIPQIPSLMKRSIIAALLFSGLTLVVMAIIWGPSIPKLWNPEFNPANYGMPMLLYEPRASFVAWIVLMILISPILQFLVSTTISTIRIAWFLPKIKLQVK